MPDQTPPVSPEAAPPHNHPLRAGQEGLFMRGRVNAEAAPPRATTPPYRPPLASWTAAKVMAAADRITDDTERRRFLLDALKQGREGPRASLAASPSEEMANLRAAVSRLYVGRGAAEDRDSILREFRRLRAERDAAQEEVRASRAALTSLVAVAGTKTLAEMRTNHGALIPPRAQETMPDAEPSGC
jgi:hypothetical protein